MKTVAVFTALLAAVSAVPLSSDISDPVDSSVDSGDFTSDVAGDITSDVAATATADSFESKVSSVISRIRTAIESEITHTPVSSHSRLATHTPIAPHSRITALPTGERVSTHKVRPTGTRPWTTKVRGTGVPISTGTPKNSTGGNTGSGAYKMYNGDGSAGAGWPAMSSWVSSFDTLWDMQQANLKQSCSNIFKSNEPLAVDNSAQETADLKAAIQSVAKDAKVDPRFALAIVMQESGGCVRAYNTSSPGDNINNPGLMQDHNGAHTCNAGANQAGKYIKGKVSNPCPKDQITGMVQDGIAGTSAGDGLKQTLAQALSKFQAKDAQGYYVAARLYNAGSYNGNDLGAPGATRCYCTDVANRLTGWNGGNTGCKLGAA